MSKVCRTAQDFADAVKSNEEKIIIEGDLKNAIFKIKATGKVAWAVCIASIAVAIAAIAVAPAAGGAPAGAALVMAGPAAATLGAAAVPAVAIAVCAGGVGVLNTLRDKYKIVEKTDEYIILERK